MGYTGIQFNGLNSNNLFENVIDEDLASLYPSIILSHNIDSETMIGKITECLNKEVLTRFGEMISENNIIDIGNRSLGLPSFSNIIDNLENFVN